MRKPTWCHMIRGLAVLIAVAVLGIGCSAPSTAPVASTEVNPGKVTVLLASFGAEKFSFGATGGAAGLSTGDDFARLFHGFAIDNQVQDGRKVLSPGIVSKWALSGDGKTWTLTVRQGAKFHNGADITTDDVLWSLQRTWGPQAITYTLVGNNIPTIKNMDRIEQTGPNEISIVTKTPVPSLAIDMSASANNWYGAVFPKQPSFADQKDIDAYQNKPVGAGSMKFVNHMPGSSITLERFADYYHQPSNGFATDKRVKFAQVEFQLVPEEATRVSALRAGQADIAPISLSTRKQVEAGGGRAVFVPEGAVVFFRLFGCWDPKFACSDRRVRQALDLAIDRQTMRDRLFGSDVMTLKGWNVISPSTIGYSSELDPSPYDPAKARQLLADAGYPGGRGFGQMVITTWQSRAVPFMPESAQLMVDTWKKELGIDAIVSQGEEIAVRDALKNTTKYYGQIVYRDNDARIDAAANVGKLYGALDQMDRPHNDAALATEALRVQAIVDPVAQERALVGLYKQLRELNYDISVGFSNIPWGAGPRIVTWQPDPLTFFASGFHTIVLK